MFKSRTSLLIMRWFWEDSVRIQPQKAPFIYYIMLKLDFFYSLVGLRRVASGLGNRKNQGIYGKSQGVCGESQGIRGKNQEISDTSNNHPNIITDPITAHPFWLF